MTIRAAFNLMRRARAWLKTGKGDRRKLIEQCQRAVKDPEIQRYESLRGDLMDLLSELYSTVYVGPKFFGRDLA